MLLEVRIGGGGDKWPKQRVKTQLQPNAWDCSLDSLLCLMAQEGDSGSGRDYHALHLRDCLTAVAIQAPRYRYHS